LFRTWVSVMIRPSRGLLALLAVFLLSLPTPARAASGPGASCFGASFVYEAFTNRSRVVQISICFVVAGYFFLKGTVRR
jgi:hypothetical protein